MRITWTNHQYVAGPSSLSWPLSCFSSTLQKKRKLTVSKSDQGPQYYNLPNIIRVPFYSTWQWPCFQETQKETLCHTNKESQTEEKEGRFQIGIGQEGQGHRELFVLDKHHWLGQFIEHFVRIKP